MDVAINRDNWTEIAHTETARGQQGPFLVFAGLTRFELELIFEGVENLTPSNDMAWQTFTEQDHMPASLLSGEHAVESGNGKNFSQGDGCLGADLIERLAGYVSKTLRNFVQDRNEVFTVFFGLLQDQ